MGLASGFGGARTPPWPSCRWCQT